MKALIVGASGDNGAHVTQRLAQHGHRVRGLVRNPERAIAGLHEVVTGDVVTGAGLDEALADIDVAFYFVHALDATDRRTDQRDETAAHRFVKAAQAARLPRCVFFTTLAPPDGIDPPAYQRNRLEVERILLDGIPGTTVVRAGMVAGASSRSLLLYVRLVQRFPVIPLGPWRGNRVAVVDPCTVTDAIITAGTDDALAGRVLDVPACAEPTHEQFIRAIARQLGLRRLTVPIPVATPRLDAALVSAVTGQSYDFCRYILSVNAYDYTVDPGRARPLSAIRPRGFNATLGEALTAIPCRATAPRPSRRRQVGEMVSGREPTDDPRSRYHRSKPRIVGAPAIPALRRLPGMQPAPEIDRAAQGRNRRGRRARGDPVPCITGRSAPLRIGTAARRRR